LCGFCFAGQVLTRRADKKRALDLFCGGGGAAEGLHRAGFEITGVDLCPQPDYPFEFIQANALSVPLDAYDFVWASPPCKKHTSLRNLPRTRDKKYPDLVTPTCKLLRASGKPYCIENVPDAPLRRDLVLCGTMFQLGTADGEAELRRHRIFEVGGFPVPPQPECNHGQRPSVIGIYGNGKGSDRQGRRAGQIRPIREKSYTQQQCDEAMGIDWMRMETLSQAVPPLYSLYVAEHFLRTLAVGGSPLPQAGKAAVTFRWPGGKAGLAPLIISHAPRSGRKFIDLFAGRGNVTFRAWFENLQFEQWILNDPLTTPFFRALRDYRMLNKWWCQSEPARSLTSKQP
jgi:DNA (cytosine-5)-methyltransferase 1